MGLKWSSIREFQSTGGSKMFLSLKINHTHNLQHHSESLVAQSVDNLACFFSSILVLNCTPPKLHVRWAECSPLLMDSGVGVCLSVCVSTLLEGLSSIAQWRQNPTHIALAGISV